MEVLRRYATGEISAREAAWKMGPNSTEHDVYVDTLRAGLSVPSPPEDVVAAEVTALRTMFGIREVCRDGTNGPLQTELKREGWPDRKPG